MRYIKMMGLAVVAALACCAGGTATAFAEGGPLIGYCHLSAVPNTGDWEDEHCLDLGTLGQEPFEEYLLRYPYETLTVLASAINTQLLSSIGVIIECSKLKLLPGAYILGGSPATDLEQILYSGCSVNGHPSCDVYSTGQPLGSIQTEPLESELVYVGQHAAELLDPDESGTLFRPQPPLTDFVKIQIWELATSACPAALQVAGGVPVSGNVVLLNDEPLEHLLLHVLLALKKPIKNYYLGHTGTAHPVKLELGGVEAKYLGEVSVDVTLLNSNLNLAWWLCP
jgi:hypothetical protein